MRTNVTVQDINNTLVKGSTTVSPSLIEVCRRHGHCIVVEFEDGEIYAVHPSRVTLDLPKEENHAHRP